MLFCYNSSGVFPVLCYRITLCQQKKRGFFSAASITICVIYIFVKNLSSREYTNNVDLQCNCQLKFGEMSLAIVRTRTVHVPKFSCNILDNT